MHHDRLLPVEMLSQGEWADVAEVCGDSTWVGRMAELGVRSGCRLQMLQAGTPCLLGLAGGCRLCLRSEECMRVLVRPVAIAG